MISTIKNVFILLTPYFTVPTWSASIQFLGVESDVVDFSALGKEGYWFPGISCPSYSYESPTNYNEYDGLKTWAGPLKHIQRWELKEYVNRSFSMDGPCSTVCGDSSFNTITLPGGASATSGIIVDPAAAENSNNSVNRIVLNKGTPMSFMLGIIVDNCNQIHSAVNSLKARGEHLGEPVEPNITPQPGSNAFNGIADIYRFQYDGFVEGDYIKIKFNGQAGSVSEGGGSSFGGILFDLPQ